MFRKSEDRGQGLGVGPNNFFIFELFSFISMAMRGDLKTV